ncbi:MAG: ABC transporter permease [Methanobacteriota archaeon]|nr:MAG: ABC transporter permease [Euryarchaeota archaeon]
MDNKTRKGKHLGTKPTYMQRMMKNHTAIIGLIITLSLVFVAILAPWIAPYDPVDAELPDRLSPPQLITCLTNLLGFQGGNHPRQTGGRVYLLGADEQGRDILSRLIYGSRTSLRVGVVAVSIALVAGLVLGTCSGYYGGRLDTIIMRAMDILLAFPAIVLAIAIMTIFEKPSINNAMIAIGIVNIPRYARVVRGAVLSTKQNEYVEAVKALGASNLRIIFKHVLPNCLAPIIVYSTLGVATAILEAAALSFLGLGSQPPTPDWGAMLADGREYLMEAWHVSTFPGIAIVVTVLGFNMLGDGLRDVMDPHLKY